MGILLSKGLQGVTLAQEGPATTSKVRNRRPRNEAIEEPPTKRRKKTNVSSHFETAPLNVTHTPEHVEKVKSTAERNLRQTPSKNILESPESQLRAPPSTTKSRKRKTLEDGGIRGYDTISQVSTAIETPLSTSKSIDTTFNLAEAPTTAPRATRKRKAPTSPYFDVPPSQLSTPPTTPKPSSPARVRESKVSVIESFDEPASLPHFRPTSPNEFGLIQEKLRHEPWKMLVAVMFLNKTTAKVAIPLLGQHFERWPTPEALSQGAPLQQY
jgi:hypothetical protein